MKRLACAVLLCVSACQPAPESSDDSSTTRIVTLAPHLAELVFAVGAGDQLVGVSAYSDFPPAVTEIPVVSDAFTVDHEALTLLEPDLMLAWESGMPASTVGELRAQGYPVEVIRTQSLDDIESAMRTIGRLAGREADGDALADRFRGELRKLRDRYKDARRLRVFYQISDQPLYTVNGAHYVSDILSICGADNVFADVAQLAPNIDTEAVLAQNPDAIVASGNAGRDVFEQWRRFPDLQAVKTSTLILVPGDELGRPSNRVLIAAERVCEALDAARAA